MVLDRVSELENEEYMSMTAEGAAVFRYLY